MDEYFCCKSTEEDFKLIASNLLDSGTVIFSYSEDKITCFVVLLSIDFKKIGVLPFGGNPTGNICMGVYGRGFNHFNPNTEMRSQYLSEKINVPEADAIQLSNLFNGVRKYLDMGVF